MGFYSPSPRARSASVSSQTNAFSSSSQIRPRSSSLSSYQRNRQSRDTWTPVRRTSSLSRLSASCESIPHIEGLYKSVGLRRDSYPDNKSPYYRPFSWKTQWTYYPTYFWPHSSRLYNPTYLLPQRSVKTSFYSNPSRGQYSSYDRPWNRWYNTFTYRPWKYQAPVAHRINYLQSPLGKHHYSTPYYFYYNYRSLY